MGLSFTSRGLRTDELTVNNDLMQPAPPIASLPPDAPSIVTSIPLIVAGLRLTGLAKRALLLSIRDTTFYQ